MAFTIRQLQYFVAVAEQGTVSRAAQNLSISQSSVTEAIKELESDLGVALFERHPRGLTITHKGHQFLRHATKILADVSDARRAFFGDPPATTGRLQLGVTSLVAGYVLSDLLARYPPRSSGRRDHGDRGQWRLSRASAGRRQAGRRGDGHVQPARPHGAAIGDHRGLGLPAVAAARSPAGVGRDHRRRRHRGRAADHADGRRDRGEHRQAARRASAQDRTSPSAPARWRRCAAWSPPGRASRSCPTSSTGPGRWKATVSNRAISPARCRWCRSAWSGGAAPACRAAARDFIGMAQAQRTARQRS